MSRRNKKISTRDGLIAAVDLGTTKAVCFIARVDQDGGAEVIGIHQLESRGLRAGNIVDMDGAEAIVRSVVERAEQMAEENVSGVFLSQTGGAPESKLISFDVSIGGHEIGDADLRRALDPAWLHSQQSEDRSVLHTIPVGYTVDGNRGVHDPRGMFGEKLGVSMHVMTAGAGAVRNLAACAHRCNLEIEAQVLSGYASSLACLVDEERELGVTCIDMGGGTTKLAVCFDGEILHTDCIPIGGEHVTSDIARGLSTPRSFAERIKTLFGSAIPSPSDDNEVIKVPLVGEEDASDDRQIPRSMLVGIVRPRIEEIFEMVRIRLEAAKFDKVAGRRVVLTGGASQLTGVVELASEFLDKQVRLGKPAPVKGLADSTNGPSFSTAAGLITYGLKERGSAISAVLQSAEAPNGRFGRLGSWIRENI